MLKILHQVVAWIEVVVEAFFGSLTDETDLIKIIYNNVTNMVTALLSFKSSEILFLQVGI